jgi:hypothetical protein|tara:strand:+ start:1459 stop:1614 length:156 start_codon:yes stop_codon:yes gene_type:complete
MINLIKPILLQFVASRPVKELIVDLLAALAKRTDNDLDDLAVEKVRQVLLG